jgi:hypothetical protein
VVICPAIQDYIDPANWKGGRSYKKSNTTSWTTKAVPQAVEEYQRRAGWCRLDGDHGTAGARSTRS